MKVEIYKNLFGFSRFLICVEKKEIFVHGSFKNIDIALVAMEKDSISRKEIWLNQIKSSKLESKSLASFIQEHQELLDTIKLELEKKGLNYSWLQMLQLLILNEDDNDFSNNIKLLENFYQQNIIKELNI